MSEGKDQAKHCDFVMLNSAATSTEMLKGCEPMLPVGIFWVQDQEEDCVKTQA